jgi:hypothetical protein
MLHAVSEYGSLAAQQVSFPMLGVNTDLEHSIAGERRRFLRKFP